MDTNTNNELSQISSTELLQAGFILFKTSENHATLDSCLYCNTIVFILEGSVKVHFSNIKTKLVNKQHFCFLPMLGNYTCEFAPYSKAIFFRFGNPSIKDLDILHTPINLLVDSQHEQIVELEIIEPLDSFLALLVQYLEKDYQDCKLYNANREELFCLLRKIYSREELSHFYSLLANSSLDFEQKVIEKFIEMKTVKDLADYMGYGVHSFRSKFKQVFGIPPSQWLQQQKAKLILCYLIKYDYDFKIIIDKFIFTSHSHFYKFCKKHYFLIPEELKKILNR